MNIGPLSDSSFHPRVVQDLFQCRSVLWSQGKHPSNKDLASAVGERKEQSYSVYSKSWDGHAAIFVGLNNHGL